MIARSFERIHRANLLMFGVAPVVASDDVLQALKDVVQPGSLISVEVLDKSEIRPWVSIHVVTAGREARFECVLQTDTTNEYRLAAAGGLLALARLD